MREVRCRHDACGAETRVRLPRALSAGAVRRVVCDSCNETYECEGAVDEGVAKSQSPVPASPEAPPPPPSAPRGWLSDPESPVWRYLSIPVAAAVVIGVLALIQGC